VRLKLTFKTEESKQNFINQTGETDIDNVNICLINYVVNFQGIDNIECVGEPIEFLVLKDGNWEIELVADPITRILNKEILEPANSKIKMLGESSWDSSDTYWAQVRISNRYYPITWPVGFSNYTKQRDVEVIVMDSGITSSHVEFNNVTIKNLYKVGDLSTFDDEIHHGTAIASLIVGSTLGVCSDANLVNVKITGSNFKPGLVKLGEAFDAILNYHNSCPDIPKVLNMSWMMPKSLYIENKLQQLHNSGILLMAAAPNVEMNIDEVTPAGFVHSFTIAASTKDDREMVAVYGVDKKISLYAPGVDLTVASHDSDTGYVSYSGASFSTALASAVAAQHFLVGNTAPVNSVVAINMINDATPYALMLNSNVTAFENRLLHNYRALGVSLVRNQYIGAIPLATLKLTGLSFPIERFIEIPPGAENSYAIEWSPSIDQSLVTPSNITENGIVNILCSETAEVSETVTPISFKLKFIRPGLEILSPDIYFYILIDSNVDKDAVMPSILSEISPYDDARLVTYLKDERDTL
jgi:subtilisin family serine protease